MIELEKTYLEQKKSPEEILRATGHIRDIIYPDKKELEYQGKSINEQVFELSENMPELRRAIIRVFSKYIQSPIILDDFENDIEKGIEEDKERQKLETKIFESNREAYDFYHSNKLRMTNIRQLVHFFDLLKKSEKITNPKLNNLENEIWDDIEENNREAPDFKKYQLAPEEEKLKVVEKASDFARKVAIDFIDKNMRKG